MAKILIKKKHPDSCENGRIPTFSSTLCYIWLEVHIHEKFQLLTSLCFLFTGDYLGTSTVSIKLQVKEM